MINTLICVPCMDMMHTAFVQSLMGLTIVGKASCSFRTSSLIYDSRNTLVKEAVAGGFDRMLWFDSDMVFDKDLMERLSKRLDEGAEIVSALCFRRKPPIKPTIYKEVGFFKDGDKMKPGAIPYEDYPRDSFFEVGGFGFGCVMNTVEMAKKVADTYKLPFSPAMGFGEDLSFCGRVAELGIKMYCDSSVKCGHLSEGIVTENDYIAIKESEGAVNK